MLGDRLSTAASEWFCPDCDCLRENMHLWPPAVHAMADSEEKTALLALLGQPRTVAYALEADARLRPFATTAAIVRSMFWHCKPLKPKSGAKTPKNILKSVLCCSLGSDPSVWDT